MAVERPARPAAAAEPAAPSLPLLLTALGAGALLALTLIPSMLPGIERSLAGESPQAFWFISRATAMVSFALLWASMALGLAITSKAARLWPGGPAAFELHQHTSLLGLAFAALHAAVLMWDGYIGYTLAQLLTPFASEQYRPLWVGLGQLSLYGMALVGLSFYARSWITPKGWRAVHFLSFVVFALALAHGIASGTDSASPIVSAGYWLAGGSIMFGTVYRILAARYAPARAGRA